MKLNYSYFIVILSIALFVFPQPAHAIVFLPALLLIPIAKILAIILGAFSLPAMGIGVLFHKIHHASLSKILLLVVFALCLLGLGIAIFLKIENPDRPWL